MNSFIADSKEDGEMTNIRDIFSELDYVWKISLTCLSIANILVNLGFKFLIVRLSLKSGPLKKNPVNFLILIDEFQKLIGVFTLSSRIL